MSSSSIRMQDDEFLLVVPALNIFAPISNTDKESEALFYEIEPILEMGFAAIKTNLEEKFPGKLRVGYDVS